MVADWVGGMTMAELLAPSATRRRCLAARSTASPTSSRIRNIAARGNMLVVDERAGELVLPAPVPRLPKRRRAFRHAGRAKGADTDDVLGEWLGVGPARSTRCAAPASI